MNLSRISTTGKAILISLLMTPLAEGNLHAENYSIRYYGIESPSLDGNMIRLTGDLYYTQLCEIGNLSVTDMRTDPAAPFNPENMTPEHGAVSFYTEIRQNEESSVWTATIHVIKGGNGGAFTSEKEYGSFYKILTEPKSELQKTIKSLISGGAGGTAGQSADTLRKEVTARPSTEFLSGTWTGEDEIDKIVIMRGGRGFVIYRNGATMTISVMTSETDDPDSITIRQNGKANASFYPQIPRKTALEAAVNAAPIEWNMRIDGENTLTGEKRTLVMSDAGTAAVPGTVAVSWHRKTQN